MRILSQLLRNLKSSSEKSKVLKVVDAWKSEQSILPSYKLNKQTLLIIRLDDIGDYLLFRNFLEAYNQSPVWKSWQKTLLGNIVWKSLFELWNKNAVDNTIWLDKKKYLHDDVYRFGIWKQLREQGFEAVVCPSRTRPLLLDDMCTQSTGAGNTYGSKNTLPHSSWNTVSDNLFKNLFRSNDNFCHEFEFNKQFANWCCNLKRNDSRPLIPNNSEFEKKESVVCFIGASAKSKRWPDNNWIPLINQLQSQFNYKVLIAGGADEIGAAAEICSRTSAINITGKKTLPEMVHVITESKAVISNDTMAAHMAVACQTPVVILANGNNYYRFTDYTSLNIDNVSTVYPQRFLNWKAHASQKAPYTNVVSSDIEGISPDTVIAQVKRLIS